MALLYAILLIVMAVAQLFTFEEFIELITSFNLPLASGALVFVIPPLLVVSEVFALPFLLRMPLSRAFRWLSMILGWLAAFLWVFITGWVVLTAQPVEAIGFVGTVAPLTPGWWAVLISIAFGILAAWASWGMWPRRGKSLKKQL